MRTDILARPNVRTRRVMPAENASSVPHGPIARSCDLEALDTPFTAPLGSNPRRRALRTGARSKGPTMSSDTHDLTELLQAHARGDGTALDRLFPVVYEE